MAIAFRAGSNASNNAAGGTTASVSVPSGTVAGDLMLSIISIGSGSVTYPDVSGWTNIFGSDIYVSNASNNKCKAFYRFFQEGDSGPSTTLSAARNWAFICASYSGVDTTTPINLTEDTGWNQTTFASSTTVTTDAITATSPQWLVSAAVGNMVTAVQTTWTNDRTERIEEIGTTGDGTALMTMSLADSNGAASGSVTTAFTSSQTTTRVGLSFLLNESTAVPLNRPLLFGTVW